MEENKCKPLLNHYYRHFRGGIYRVIGIAVHTETKEQLVIYQAQFGSMQLYARPYDMFIEKIDKRKYPEAIQEYRFELLESKSEVFP